MADNILVDNVDETDYTVATDDDGTAHHQYVKLEFGVDSTQTKVSAANPLPITGTALVISSAPAVTGTVAISSLPGGVSTIGTVVIGGSLPAGVNTMGTVVVSSQPALTGTVAISSVISALPAGVNTLGTVVVSSAPAVTGTVAVSSLVAALPAGVNTIGTVVVSSAPAVTGTVAVSSLIAALPAGVATIGTVVIGGSLPAGTNTLGTIAPVGTFTTKETRSSTGTLSHVNPSMTVVGLLNANANRLGYSIQNDATGALYIAHNSQASTTDYTVRLIQHAYFETPFNWTGTVTGLWSTVIASDGAARITEYS